MEIRLLKKQMTAAYQYSYVRLVLNYYTFFETVAEKTEMPEQILFYGRELNQLLEKFLSGENVQEKLFLLREDITSEVEVLTAYMDCFQIYEYVLNRIERKFHDLPSTGLSDESMVETLIQFVTQSEETVVMNSRIKEIMGQLPVRLTRKKFFSLVMEGLSIYTGSSIQNLKDMLYTLRSESMVNLPKDMKKGHEELYAFLESFRIADYNQMTGEEYEKSSQKLALACENLIEESGIYVMLQEIINDFAVLTMAKADAVMEIKEEEFYSSFIKEILQKFLCEDYTLGEAAFYQKFEEMEGRQELYYERYLRAELPEPSAEKNKDENYVKAVNVDRLLSGSGFARLLDEKAMEELESDSKEVDRACLERETENYFKELEEFFSNTSKPVMRGIMAKVLSDLPVFFNSVEEFENYVAGSFESCIDEAEKETCKELLEELMDYENKLV